MTRLVRSTLPVVAVAVALVVVGSAPSAWCQTIVYRPVVPMFAPAAGPYVANYSPMGNYAAVTAFSPPVVHAAPLASVPVPVVDTVPSSSLGNTGYMPLAMSPLPTYTQPYAATQPYGTARPITTYYAPSYAPSGYAAPLTSPVGYATPISGASVYPASATVVTAGYAVAPAATPVIPVVPVAPSAVVVPLRRGLFGGYRPLRGAAVYPAW